MNKGSLALIALVIFSAVAGFAQIHTAGLASAAQPPATKSPPLRENKGADTQVPPIAVVPLAKAPPVVVQVKNERLNSPIGLHGSVSQQNNQPPAMWDTWGRAKATRKNDGGVEDVGKPAN